jgi:hypothetical protein
MLTRIWARRGTRPRRDTPIDSGYRAGHGAVCLARGTAAGLVLPLVSTAVMNAHLAEIARTVAPGAHAVLVIDGACTTNAGTAILRPGRTDGECQTEPAF